MASKSKPQSVVRVHVVVCENGVEVAEYDIAYFAGQPYKVRLDTPDGTDWLSSRIAASAVSAGEGANDDD